MRTTVLSYIGFIVIFFQILILSTITSHSAYSSAVEESLEDSVTYAVAMLQTGYNAKVTESLGSNPTVSTGEIDWSTTDEVGWANTDQFKNAFIDYLASTIDPRITDLDVNIYGADADNGVLSVEVVATFKYLDGIQSTVSCYRTVILNSTLKEAKSTQDDTPKTEDLSDQQQLNNEKHIRSEIIQIYSMISLLIFYKNHYINSFIIIDRF